MSNVRPVFWFYLSFTVMVAIATLMGGCASGPSRGSTGDRLVDQADRTQKAFKDSRLYREAKENDPASVQGDTRVFRNVTNTSDSFGGSQNTFTTTGGRKDRDSTRTTTRTSGGRSRSTIEEGYSVRMQVRW